MTSFHYRASQMWCESVAVAALTREYGTPLYIYSAGAIRENYLRLQAAFEPLHPSIYYAVKANGNLSLLRLLKEAGAGFDIVSGGELHRVRVVGADPERVVFAGVGKTDAELCAALDARVGWLNVESADELGRLGALASARGQRVRVALRLNPGVEPDTHPHIRTGGASSKFGIPLDEARDLFLRAEQFPALDLVGVHLHIGSQMADPGPLLRALDAALGLVAEAPSVATLDFGGGFPVPYHEDDVRPSLEAFAAPVVAKLSPLASRLSFHLEPGRYLVASAGALVATVQAVKQVGGRRMLVVDTGMHHLLRPALYDAYHRVWPLEVGETLETPSEVVGPICESADVLARDRRLPALRPGDGLALLDAGAYGFSMASNYNAQPRPAEVLVDGDQARLIRRRETWDDLIALETENALRAA